MRTLWLPTALLLLAGCAGTAGSLGPSAGPAPRVTAVGGGYDMRISGTESAAAFGVHAAPEAAWSALLAAYQKLGIPPTGVDADQRTVGTQSFDVRRRLGDQPLSQFLDCGSNLTGPIANSYNVNLTVTSTLKANPQGGSFLGVAVAATARSPQGGSGVPVNCGSTGRLESDLARLVQSAGAH